MKGRYYCFMLVLQLVILVSAATRPFLPNHAIFFHHPGPAEAPHGSKGVSVSETEKMKESALYKRGVSKIGSSPPICEHKCNECTPCEAIQVPSTNTHTTHFGTQYTNYEPESWKCKCGPSFYSP